MKKIWEKNKIIIIILGYFAIAGSLIYFVFIPKIADIKAAANEIQEKIIDQEMDDSRLSKLSDMKKDQTDYDSNLDSMKVILEPDQELTLIKSIESIASQSGCIIMLNIGEKTDSIEINKIKRSGSKKGDGEKGIMDKISYNSFFPIQINLKGNYNKTMDFIRMLENSWIYVNIISIHASPEIILSDKLSNQNNNQSGQEAQSAEKKKTLSTTINAIVYTQK